MSDGTIHTLQGTSTKHKLSRSMRTKTKLKKVHHLNKREDDALNASENQPNAFTNKKNVMWVILSGAMALTFVVMLFLPDSGMGTGLIATYSAMLWCGFFGSALWRYSDKSGWSGFAFGSLFGFVLQFASQLL